MDQDDRPGAGHREIPGTASFSKFVKVLQTVSDADKPLAVADIVALTGLPRPTAYRIVAGLLAEGMLDEVLGQSTLVPGARLISLAGKSSDRSDLRRVARAPLLALSDRINETIHLAVRTAERMTYIDKLESRRTVRMMSRIGMRVPFHSSSVGKAWLAALPVEEATKILASVVLEKRTAHTITNLPDLLKELEETRQRGFSLDLEENEIDICCYGHVIRGPDARPIGCISVSMPRYRFEATPTQTITDAMADCVSAIVLSLPA